MAAVATRGRKRIAPDHIAMEKQNCRFIGKRIRGGKKLCYIDGLPDEILVNILARLKLKEAARTCVLSHRWRNLWTCSANLDFDNDSSDDKFMEFVNHALDIHSGSTVDFLRIAFDAFNWDFDIEEDDVRASLENWVGFARSKRVRSLELDLNHSLSGSSSRFMSPYVFPMDQDPFRPGFHRLTALSLKSVSMSDADIVYLLSSPSSCLEILSVENAQHLQNVKVTSSKLNQLEIGYCHNLRSICIVSAPNLQSLKHVGEYIKTKPSIRLCFKDVPKLSHVSLDGPLCQNNLLDLPHHVEKLELDMEFVCREPQHIGCMKYPRHFPQLSNLKQLELKFTAYREDSLMDLIFIVSACPNLHKVTFKYEMNIADDGHALKNHLAAGKSYTHHCLRVVEFHGWAGLFNEIEFATYLIDIATNIEKVIFIPKQHHGEDNWKTLCAVARAQRVIAETSKWIDSEIIGCYLS